MEQEKRISPQKDTKNDDSVIRMERDEVVAHVSAISHVRKGCFVESLICCLLPCLLPLTVTALIVYAIYVYAFNNGNWSAYKNFG